jgi:cytoskeletal protein CcmA (bactofilin family)
MADEKKTLVEDGTELKGSISSKCPIVVRGKIDGEVQAPALTVSDTGAVHGTVKVGQMTSQGEISGEFDAESIQLSGTVKDNTIIRAKTLEVKITSATSKMQVVFGETTLEVGEAPARVETGTGGKKKGKSEDKESVPPGAE